MNQKITIKKHHKLWNRTQKINPECPKNCLLELKNRDAVDITHNTKFIQTDKKTSNLINVQTAPVIQNKEDDHQKRSAENF